MINMVIVLYFLILHLNKHLLLIYIFYKKEQLLSFRDQIAEKVV